MKLRGWIPVVVLMITSVAAFAAPETKTPPIPKYAMPLEVPTTPPPGGAARTPDGALADSVVLSTVGPRSVRVINFLESFYGSYVEFRPKPDSLGKIQFLKTMGDKEVLGLVAEKANRPLDFEDRVKLREHNQRVLANVLFQRMIIDSIQVSESEIRKVYTQYQYRIHARHILFTDRATATRVRAQLIAGTISFPAAVKKYSLADDRAQDGDMGWAYRLTMDADLADQVYDLKPGELSPVIKDVKGYHVIQIIEREPVKAPAYNAVHSMIEGTVWSRKVTLRSEEWMAQGRKMIGLTYDTTNIKYAASKFQRTQTTGQEAGAPTFDIDATLPEFSPADTALVLARYTGGTYSLGRFMHSYSDLSPVLRPSINDFEAFRNQLDGQVLEPQLAEIARQRGLDKDPMTLAFNAKKLEEIRVEHMFQDSIESRVQVTKAERQKYYEDHKREFVTFASVRYAQFVVPSKAAAESIEARLKAGAKATDMVLADSLVGNPNSAIQTISANEHGTANYKVLLEELRPGQVVIEGPDKTGQYQVLQSLEYTPSRDMPYAEVEGFVDESVHNIKSEQALKNMIARHRKEYTIREHFELLPWVRMSDPADRKAALAP